MAQTEHAVVIGGAGPTGMMLAAELALAGIDVVIVERRPTPELVGSRAGGLHARTVEVLDQRGVAERFVSQGKKHPAVMHAGGPLDITDLPTRHNYTLELRQNHIERILAEWITELGVPVHRGFDVVGFIQDEEGVDVTLSGERTIRAQYLVACDGGRSAIRKMAGIDFPGAEATASWLIAQVQTAEEPQWGFHEDAVGRHAIGKGDDSVTGIVLAERDLSPSRSEPDMEDLRAALISAYGTDFGVHSPTWISRFTDAARQAASYSAGRVILAGDAAHIHSPHGGQGLNTGVQDAVNLGWKLAQVLRGTSPANLLDTYHAERHPVGARVIRNTLAQVALLKSDPQSRALREVVSEIARMDEPRKKLTAETTGLDIHYDFGSGHPLLGRRMPDLDLITTAGPVRAFSFMHRAQHLLFNFANHAFDAGPWAPRLEMVKAQPTGAWNIPAIGLVPTPAAVLVRPDGYVAWVAEDNPARLEEALDKWVGSQPNL